MKQQHDWHHQQAPSTVLLGWPRNERTMRPFMAIAIIAALTAAVIALALLGFYPPADAMESMPIGT